MELLGYSWFGLVACIWLIFAVFYSIVGFRGMHKEPFSFLNHFISELGDPRFAPKKTLFNVGLIGGGFLLIPFIIGLALQFNSIIGFITMAVGIIVAILCALIGFFSEEKVQIHFFTAGAFFVGMILQIILFGIMIWIQPSVNFPLWTLIICGIALGLVFAFLIDTGLLDKVELKRTDEPWDWGDEERPKFWLNPFLEWWGFIGIIGWLLCIAILSF